MRVLKTLHFYRVLITMATLKKSFITIGFLTVFSLVGCQTSSEEHLDVPEAADSEILEPTGFPAQFLAGTYEIIGRYPDSDQIYRGKASIEILNPESKNELRILRTIGEKTIEATGTLTQSTEGTLQILRVRFQSAGGERMEATYQIASDLDNYARLTGYTYVEEGGTSIPGIEALFSDHFRND